MWVVVNSHASCDCTHAVKSVLECDDCDVLTRRSRSRVRTRDMKCVLECDEDDALTMSRVRAWMQSVPQRDVDNVQREFQRNVYVYVTFAVYLSVIWSIHLRAILGHVYVHVTWNFFRGVMLAMFRWQDANVCWRGLRLRCGL